MLAITAEHTPTKFLQNQQVRAKLIEMTDQWKTNGKRYPSLNTRERRHTEIPPQPGVTGGNPFPDIQGVLHFLLLQSV